MCGQHHVPASFTAGPIWLEREQRSEKFWMGRWREKTSLYRESKPGRPNTSQVTANSGLFINPAQREQSKIHFIDVVWPVAIHCDTKHGNLLHRPAAARNTISCVLDWHRKTLLVSLNLDMALRRTNVTHLDVINVHFPVYLGHSLWLWHNPPPLPSFLEWTCLARWWRTISIMTHSGGV
jgi:hypothetical protein